MKFHLASIPTLLLCLALPFSTTIAATDQQKTDFQEAYAAYNKLSGQKKFAESLPYARKALEAGKELYGTDSKSYAALNHNLGRNLIWMSEFKEAVKVLQPTVPMYKKLYGSNGAELIDLYIDLATATRGADYTSEWVRYHGDALDIARKVLGDESADYAVLLLDLGHEEYVNQGQGGESRITEGFELLKKVAPGHPRWGYANFVMGKVKMVHELYPAAIQYLTTSIEFSKNQPGKSLDSSLMMTALGFLAVALEKTDQSDAATKHLEELGRIKESLGDRSTKPVFATSPKFPLVDFGDGGRLNTKKRNEGTVIVSYDIDEHGFTINHHVDVIVGPVTYADAAVEALKKFRYAPRFQGGQAVAITGARYEFKFLIKD